MHSSICVPPLHGTWMALIYSRLGGGWLRNGTPGFASGVTANVFSGRPQWLEQPELALISARLQLFDYNCQCPDA
jgi:hypothetical protein